MNASKSQSLGRLAVTWPYAFRGAEGDGKFAEFERISASWQAADLSDAVTHIIENRTKSQGPPAPADLRYQITTECGAVIQALAD